MDSLQLILCNKTERVVIYKIPPRSTSRGLYLDEWNEMIWQGGVKVIQKNKIVTLTFVKQNGEIFSTTKIPDNYKQAIVKTQDSSRGFGIRLENPKGGYLWIGVAFRDRNDAFDFIVAFQDLSDRRKNEANLAVLQAQYSKNVDFSIKKGQQIKINIGGDSKKKKQTNNVDEFFSDFTIQKKQQKPQKPKNQTDFDFFGAFSKEFQQKKQPKKNTTKKDVQFDF